MAAFATFAFTGREAPSTAAVKPTYTQAMLEAILGKPIIDAAKQYAAIEAASLVETYTALGLTPKAEWVTLAKA